jgi:hypothetical protein
MSDNYINSDLAECPNKTNHDGWECWRITGDNTYKCDCGCEFEWYAEDSWFIITQGVKRRGKPKEVGFLDSITIQTFFMAIFITAGIAAFFAFVIALAVGGR